MAGLFWLTKVQIRRIAPCFPLSHGVPRVDDQRVLGGILHVIRNGLRWRDAPPGYGPHKTLYSRFVRSSRLGVFNRIFAGLRQALITRGIAPCMSATCLAATVLFWINEC